MVFFKLLRSPGFHELFYQYIFSFHKLYEYCKTGAYCICVNSSRFFEPRSLDDFHEYIMSMGLHDGKTPVVQL